MKSYYLIENYLCSASVVERRILWFWTRWDYTVHFYKFMNLRPYKTKRGTTHTEAGAKAMIRHLYRDEWMRTTYQQEITKCPISLPSSSGATSLSSTAA